MAGASGEGRRIYDLRFTIYDWADGRDGGTGREQMIKIGAKVVRHSGKIIFQTAEAAVPRELFCSLLQAIECLRLPAGAGG